MKIRALIFAIAMSVVTLPAFAADVDGKWTGSIETPNGPAPVAFTFKASGDTLTGSTTAPDGSEIPIKNGKMDGGKISFDVELDFGGMKFTLAYTGVVSADEIKLKGDFMGMPFEFAVKKAK
jgi:hypothetical protein